MYGGRSCAIRNASLLRGCGSPCITGVGGVCNKVYVDWAGCVTGTFGEGELSISVEGSKAVVSHCHTCGDGFALDKQCLPDIRNRQHYPRINDPADQIRLCYNGFHPRGARHPPSDGRKRERVLRSGPSAISTQPTVSLAGNTKAGQRRPLRPKELLIEQPQKNTFSCP